ncbi:hypothetical protein CEXT_640881 [Caerostris extrusa]|uniref:Uncharacterized protein n=1 Tax=Caerostris extrusa TaxID=172846 RepID=A0AAV4MY32_CAEEX|nr:hypothetical protein CEXT_640881 [Caerostris extrusa]
MVFRFSFRRPDISSRLLMLLPWENDVSCKKRFSAIDVIWRNTYCLEWGWISYASLNPPGAPQFLEYLPKYDSRRRNNCARRGRSLVFLHIDCNKSSLMQKYAF